jgi:ankyrin repeat protein
MSFKVSLFLLACLVLSVNVPAAELSEEQVRTAAGKAIQLLQSSGKTWYEKQTCVSCHHQALPMMALKLARQHGVPVDEDLARQSAAKAFALLKSLDRAVQSTHLIDPAMDTGMFLVAAHDAGIPPSLGTSVYARLIANRQTEEGKWITIDVRPPQSYSPFTATAVAVRALQFYMPRRLAAESRDRLNRAKKWLLSAHPQNTEDRTFHLLGLAWAGADESYLKKVSTQLLSEQRSDGGWGQLPNLASDAYSTGEALVALHTVGGVPVQHRVYQRGLRFLLDTQFPDGSWLVKTRLHEQRLVSPPYFETGFPHKENQVISCMGTSWAAMALMYSLPRVSSTISPSVDLSDIQPWMEPALFGTAEELRSLLDKGLDPNSKTPEGTTLLMMAAHDPAKVQLLLERGADANAKSRTRYAAVMVAANYRGTTEAVRALLEKGADAAPKPPRPLHNASPLFYAVWSGETDKVGLLLAKGADLNQKMLLIGAFPITPLSLAVSQGDVAMVKYLVQHGAKVNQLDEAGITPLTQAVLANNTEMARALIEMRAKVNHADKLGMTPLLHAAAIDFGNSDMAQLLLEYGANPRLKSKEGLTPAQLAKKYNHANITQ